MNKESIIFIQEIFGPTIQGEGPNVGKKCIFVRAAGCDFRCGWCDSKYAWKIDENSQKYKSFDLAKQIINLCHEKCCSQVILTGGNPCLYDFSYFIDQLHKNNIKVDIETQGSKIPPWLNNCDLIVLSPKPPSSGQPNVYNNIKVFLNNTITKVAVKIPVFSDLDIEFLKEYHKICVNKASVYAMVGNDNTEKEGSISSEILKKYEIIIEKILKEKIDPIYILPQLHVLLWGNKQGV